MRNKLMFFISALLLMLSPRWVEARGARGGPSQGVDPRDRIDFLQYTAKYGKHYDNTEEFQMRYSNWLQIDHEIKSHQQHESRHEFQLGHNKFSDWTTEEKDLVLNQKLAHKLPLDFENLKDQEEFDMSFWDLPEFNGNETYSDEDSLEFEDGVDPRKQRFSPVYCPTGYRWLGTTCKQCSGGCAKCTSDTSCRACMSRNFAFDRRRRTCSCYTGPYNETSNDCDICGTGLFWDGDTCESCEVDNCERCKKVSYCTSCVEGFQRRQGRCYCRGTLLGDSQCLNCASNQFITGGACVDCPQNCSTCSSPMGFCMTCTNPSFNLINGGCFCDSEDYFVHNVTGLCTLYTYCGSGNYNDGQNNCLPCAAHCTSCNAVTGYCNICNDPSMEFMNDTTSSALWHVDPAFQSTELGQCRCPPKSAFSGGICIPLSVQCADGSYNDGLNNCVACPDNCTTCTDFLGWCMTCPDSSYMQTVLNDTGRCKCEDSQVVAMDNSCQTKTDCGLGNYNNGRNVCSACQAYCQSCDFVTGDCLICQPTFSLISPAQQCSCLTTQFLDPYSGQCTDIIDCGANFYNDGINNCIACNSANCDVCTVSTGVCTTCKDTYRYNSDNDTCYCPYPETYWSQASNGCHDITLPPSGQYNLGANLFADCPTNCSACHTDIYDFSGQCTGCELTFTMNATNNCTCQDKQYKNSAGACVACADNCDLCEDFTGKCYQCGYSGYTLSNGVCMCLNNYVVQTDQHCAPLYACSDGQYNDGANNCAVCNTASNCLQCSGYEVCTTCKSTYSLSAQRTNQCDCVSGTQFESGSKCHTITSCGAWYYNDGYNNCYNCRENCTYCTGYNACTSCTSPYTLNYPSTGLCACNWQQYRYYYQNNCQTCRGGYGCGICRDPDGYCNQCRAYWTWYNWHCYCWSPSYSSNSECYPCPDGCSACSGTSHCTSCSSSFTLHYPYNYQCSCQSSQYMGSNIYCYSCPSYTYTCQDYTAYASTCYDTFEIINNQCACSTDKFLSTSVTTGLPACVSLTACGYNQYNRGDNYCNNCPSNSNCLDCDLNSSGVPKCTQCDATFTYFDNEGTYGTCRCLSGEYKTSSNECVSCGANMITCADSTGYATSCDASYTINYPSTGQCSCLSDQFLSQGTCTNCPTDCATCTSLSTCTSCDASFTLHANHTCSCDLSTTYLNTGNNTCVHIYDPPDGYYNDGFNNFIACGPYCSVCTSAAAGDCTQCNPTFTLKQGECACQAYTQFLSSGSCVKIIWCGNGQYNDGYNNCGTCTTNCTNCLHSATNCTGCSGTFTLHYPGFGNCACGQGYYQTASGPCAANKQNCSIAADSTGICSTCVDTFSYDAATDQCYCPAHTAWIEANNTCVDCASGCDTCTSGTFCTGCKSSYIFEASTGTCACNTTSIDHQGLYCQKLSECPDGQYNPGDQTCIACDPGCAKCDMLDGRCNECESTHFLLAGYCNQWRRLEHASCKGYGCAWCDEEQQCLECEPGMVQSMSDPKSCVFDQASCEYSVGAVESSQRERLCLQKPYSEERLVPEYEIADTNVDWRVWGVVRPSKDQGKCGGDFAFSTAASAESQFAIKTGKLYDLSEQYLLDCDTLSQGCKGGWHESAGYLLSTSGAVLEQDYPYVGVNQECKQELIENKVFKLQYPGTKQVEPSKEAFKSQLRKGPVQVSFKVTDALFYQYDGGVLPADYCQKSESRLNHSMLAIGYGIDSSNNSEYALIQNQWGQDWGESGIFRIELTDDSEGPCGLYLNTAYSLL